MRNTVNELLAQALDVAMKAESLELARLIARLIDEADWNEAEDRAYLAMLEEEVRIARDRYDTSLARFESEKFARTKRLETA